MALIILSKIVTVSMRVKGSENRTTESVVHLINGEIVTAKDYDDAQNQSIFIATLPSRTILENTAQDGFFETYYYAEKREVY